MSSLSPHGNTGLGYGLGLYKPRRPSYTYATQVGRQRTESYRYALRKSAGDSDEQSDFIEGISNKRNRKESYVRAIKRDDGAFEMLPIAIKVDGPGPPEHTNSTEKRLSSTTSQYPDEYMQELKAAIANRTDKMDKDSPDVMLGNNTTVNNEKQFPVSNDNNSMDTLKCDTADTPCSELSSNVPSIVIFTFKKNLVFLCISFIMLFSAFRAIQNLQSSLNDDNNLGIIAMSCVHGAMFVTCLWAPTMINTLSAKWALVFGMFSFLTWTGANFYPSFYTLIPTALFSGWGQGIMWTAEISYILKLAFDSSRVTKDGIDKEVFRFHGIFLACFQTTHIWGNLISSVIISSVTSDVHDGGSVMYQNMSIYPKQDMGATDTLDHCGVLFPCSSMEKHELDLKVDKYPVIWKLMSAYLVLGFVGFCLIFFCLDNIGARVYPEKSGLQIVMQHVTLLYSHKTFRLLIPLLVFSGLQQGFIFADFNKAYVTCTIGLKYIGYTMIVMGFTNVISAVLVALCAKYVPREVVFGVGGIIHMGLMIVVLIWIPGQNFVVHFIVSASWGICDAVWQTQCNTIICVTCPEEADIAFANYRMLQSFGLMFAFLAGSFMCVSGKLYFLMVVLVVAIMCYVLAEYRVRQIDSNEANNEVFEEPTTTH